MIEIDGKTQCISAWAEEFGVHDVSLRQYMNTGLSLTAAAQKIIERRASGFRKNYGKRK